MAIVKQQQKCKTNRRHCFVQKKKHAAKSCLVLSIVIARKHWQKNRSFGAVATTKYLATNGYTGRKCIQLNTYIGKEKLLYVLIKIEYTKSNARHFSICLS